jgi:chemotaxis protein histidine kinase CheA
LTQLTVKGLERAMGAETTAEQATKLHQSIAKRLREDILRTTPQRIIDLVSPDLSTADVMAIRRRISEAAQQRPATDRDEDLTIATARPQHTHDIERFKKCPTCQNTDQASFVLDRKNGDMICSHCGVIVSESITHEGSAYRKFEGEADRNHHVSGVDASIMCEPATLTGRTFLTTGRLSESSLF